MVNRDEALVIISVIGIIAIVIFLIAVWWWVVWVAVGIGLDYMNFYPEGRIFIHAVIWAIIVSLMGVMGRIGYNRNQ